jgi:hypothetical protein
LTSIDLAIMLDRQRARNCWARGGADARTRTANRPITRSVHASSVLPGAEKTAPTLCLLPSCMAANDSISWTKPWTSCRQRTGLAGFAPLPNRPISNRSRRPPAARAPRPAPRQPTAHRAQRVEARELTRRGEPLSGSESRPVPRPARPMTARSRRRTPAHHRCRARRAMPRRPPADPLLSPPPGHRAGSSPSQAIPDPGLSALPCVPGANVAISHRPGRYPQSDRSRRRLATGRMRASPASAHP